MSKTFPQYPATSFPDTFQSLKRYQDITQADLNAYNEYKNYINNNNLNGAKVALQKIENYDNKTLTANEINTLVDTVQALQSYMNGDVWQSMVNNKQQEWESIINQFSYIGEWSSTTQYKKWNMVSYAEPEGMVDVDTGRYLYIATKTHSGVTPFDNYQVADPTWLRLTVKGTQGDSGYNGGFRGIWGSEITYSQNDIVVYDNAWYVNVSDTNLNHTPSKNSSYWSLLFEIEPKQYPIQSTQPTGQASGELWFQVLS